MCDLCDAIEDEDDLDRDQLLAQWHERAQRHAFGSDTASKVAKVNQSQPKQWPAYYDTFDR